MKIKLLFLIPLLFLFVGLFTISDYNVNWDEPEHFMRGQAYVRYILTGQKNYASMTGPRRSIYQNDSLNADYFLANDYGHPPLNDILAAVMNIILYQRLGLFGDVESYHFFILLLSATLIYLVGRWATEEHGLFAGIVASSALAFSPLFIAESHNNIKDPVESTFYAFTIYMFYKAVKTKRWPWLIACGVFGGLALGTKFNVLFLPCIIILWLVLTALPSLVKRKVPNFIVQPRAFWIVLFLSAFLPLIIFYATWPRLWGNVEPLLKTISYYKDIGTQSTSESKNFFLSFNTYASEWITYTTPPVVLLLIFFGIVGALWNQKHEKYKPSLLWLLWFLVPIVRVSLPGTSIYGGTRQIMEYLPASALLAGIGAGFISRFFSRNILVVCLLIAIVPTILKLHNLHPNQNLYFNTLIGGLPGAASKNIPGWGTTLGNPYLQGVKWLNEYAQKDATVIITLGVMTNIPAISLRPDLTYANNLESLTKREGEYIMALSYQAFPIPYYDAAYPDRFLEPIHEIKAEGVTILKIWKNDAAHTKPGFLKETDISFKTRQKISIEETIFEFDKPYYVTRLVLTYDSSACIKPEEGFVYTSLNGNTWSREPEGLFANQIPSITKNITSGDIVHLLPAVPAKFVKLATKASKMCVLNNVQTRIEGLSDIFP